MSGLSKMGKKRHHPQSEDDTDAPTREEPHSEKKRKKRKKNKHQVTDAAGVGTPAKEEEEEEEEVLSIQPNVPLQPQSEKEKKKKKKKKKKKQQDEHEPAEEVEEKANEQEAPMVWYRISGRSRLATSAKFLPVNDFLTLIIQEEELDCEPKDILVVDHEGNDVTDPQDFRPNEPNRPYEIVSVPTDDNERVELLKWKISRDREFTGTQVLSLHEYVETKRRRLGASFLDRPYTELKPSFYEVLSPGLRPGMRYKKGIQMFRTTLQEWDGQATEDTILDVDFRQLVGERIWKPYIRKCYIDLLRILEDAWKTHSERQQYFTLIGNPGIGKSYFGFFLMAHFVKQGRTVLYQNESLELNLAVSKNYCLESDLKAGLAFKKQLKEKDTIYICDAAVPTIRDVFTIMITSPKPDKWKAFSTVQFLHRLYMPVWTKDELKRGRRLLPAVQISEKDLLDKYEKYGGIPRYIWDEDEGKVARKLRSSLLKTPNQIYDIIAEEVASEAPSHIIHLIPSKDYDDCSYKFASEYVAGEFYKQVSKYYFRWMQDLVSERDSLLPTIKGQVFEQCVHDQLSAGGAFEIRPLRRAAMEDIGNLTLLRRDVRTFGKNTACTESSYFRVPKQRCGSSSIDSFEIRGSDVMLFQMTVAEARPVMHQEILQLLEDMKAPEDAGLILVFVVPGEIFRTFERQQLVGSNCKRLRNLQQYALCMDLVQRRNAQLKVEIQQLRAQNQQLRAEIQAQNEAQNQQLRAEVQQLRAQIQALNQQPRWGQPPSGQRRGQNR